MKDAIGAMINRLAEKNDRSWVRDKGCAISEGTSLVHAPNKEKVAMTAELQLMNWGAVLCSEKV